MAITGKLTLTINGIEHTGDVTLAPVAPPVVPPQPPPPPPPVPGGALPSVGLRMAGELSPATNSSPVGAKMTPTVIPPPLGTNRVSDPKFPGVTARALVPGRVPEYSQLSVDSPDGSLLLLVKPDGDHQMFRRDTLAPVGTLPSVLAPRWLPNGMICFWAGQPYRLLAIDPRTGATIAIFTSPFPYGYTAQVHEEVSEDGAWTAGIGHNGSGAGATVFAVNLRTGTLGAAFPVAPDAVNWARATPDGAYLAIQWNRSGSGRSSGVELFDIVTGTFVRQLCPEGHHGDWGRLPSGRVFYATHAVAHPANNNYPSIVLYWTDGAAATHLRMVEWGVLGHVSCRGPRGWILVSNRRAASDAPNAPGELWLLSAETGEVRRLWHHRATEASYWLEPHATLARDGKSAFFGSSWGGSTAGSYALEIG